MIAVRFLLVALFGVLSFGPAHAGLAAFSDPGKIDFDEALQLLNPYGAWSQIDGKWCFTPLDHQAPYTHGRWLYTEYGWYWQGNAPHSWATEHYGYWKRGADRVWSWYPGPTWLPQTVEIRSSTDGIGWRSAEVDRDGNFVEPSSLRFTKTDEWTFVTPRQFAGPITPEIVAPPALAEQMLEESSESVHSYLTYREIDRPGPHPADFINLGDSLMFAPMTAEQRLKALRPLAHASSPAAPRATPGLITPYLPVAPALPPAGPARPSLGSPTQTAAAPAGNATTARAAVTAPAQPAPSAAPRPDAARLAASLSASETMPEIPQQPGAEDPNDDPRQVRYWVTMSLPKPWTPKPVDAKPDQIYLYRPDIYQDEDGIQRRIAFWLDPNLRATEALHLQDVLKRRTPVAAVPTGAGIPAEAAAPAAPAHDFSSPFEESFRDYGSSKRPIDAGPAQPMIAVGDATNAAPSSAPSTAIQAPDGLAPGGTAASTPPAPDGRASTGSPPAVPAPDGRAAPSSGP